MNKHDLKIHEANNDLKIHEANNDLKITDEHKYQVVGLNSGLYIFDDNFINQLVDRVVDELNKRNKADK